MVSSDKLREDFLKKNEKTAGGFMKPKRLTIIFFSIMMLAATPRAMSHFNNYADALHQKVDAEWLNLLLGFAAPAEIEENAATPQNSQQPTVCTKGTSKDVEPATLKSRTDAKSTPSSLVSKKRSFEYTLSNMLSASTDGSSGSAPVGLRFVRKTRGGVGHAPLVPGVPVAANANGRANGEYSWSLTRSTLSRKSKAVRALMRELTTLTKTLPAGSVHVSFEKDVVQPSESDADVANQETTNGHVSSDESMR